MFSSWLRAGFVELVEFWGRLFKLSTFWFSQLQSRFRAIHRSVCLRSHRKTFVFLGPLSVQSLRSVCSLLIFLDFCCSLVVCEFIVLSIRILLTDVTNRPLILDSRSKGSEPCCLGFGGLVVSGFSSLDSDLSKS